MLLLHACTLGLHGIIDILGVEGRKPEVKKKGLCSYYLKLSVKGLAPSWQIHPRMIPCLRSSAHSYLLQPTDLTRGLFASEHLVIPCTLGAEGSVAMAGLNSLT